MSGWTPRDLINLPVKILASQTALPITESKTLTAGGAQNALVLGVFVSGIAGTCSAQLQHSLGLGVWENVVGKSATLSNGWNYIRINNALAADAALLPLFDIMRVVLNSNGSGAGSIDYIKLLQQL